MKKILATILAISLILSTLVIGAGTAVSADTAADSYVYTLDDVGKTVHVPYEETAYDCVLNFGTSYRISNKDNVSIEQTGIDGSYAMTILGSGSGESAILTLGNHVNCLENGKTYVFELTAKSTGVVPNIRFGLRGGQKENYGSWVRNNATDAITEWTTYTQEVNNTVDSPASQVWEGFRIEWRVEEGEYLYIDNIKIYEKDDTSKTNLFPNGTFEQTTYYTGDKSAMVAYAVTDYDAHKQTNYKLSSFEGVSITKEGVDGSYCLRSEGTGALLNPYIGLSTATGFLTHGKTYVISMKVRSEGAINNLQIGSLYSSIGGWVGGSGWFVNGSAEISEWTTYTTTTTYSFDNTTESTKAWDELCLQWKAPVGSVVFIDDITIYDASDATQTNIYSKGSFEIATSYATELADDTAVDNYTYTPFDISDYRMGASTNSDGTLNWNEWDHSTGIGDSDLVAITENGIKGSYALTITGDDAAHQLAVRTEPNTVGLLSSNTTYTVRFKARTSEDEALDSFGIGLMHRWDWSTPEMGMKMATPSADIGLTEIDTSWREYAFVVTTDDSFDGAWAFVYLEYSMLSEAVLYIDDIEIYDAAGNNIAAQGTFDITHEGFSNLGDADFRISPKYYGDWLVSNGQSTVPVEGFNAKAIATDNAKSGSNVLALGFNDAAYDGRIWYEMGGIRPGKTYQVEFWAMLVGDVTTASIKINDNDAYAPSTMLDEEGNEVEITEEELAKYGTPEETAVMAVSASDSASYPRTWIKYTVTYTDTTTSATKHRWAGMNIAVKGAAGSGMLIDSVSVKEIAEFGDEAPNLFKDAGFEKEAAPEVTWNDTYYGTSATDYSFMNALPKVMGAFGTGLSGDVARFKDVLAENSDFGYLGLIQIDSSNIEVARFEAKQAAAAGKEVWISANRLVSENSALASDWQANLDEMAAWIQNDIGDSFQGIYFDEPHLHFASNDEFITVTKYIRETYKKRVFSMTKHDMFGTEANVTLDAESHAYVTDVGYWNYQIEGMNERITGFHTAASKLDGNVRKWICPLLGAKNDALTEEQTMQIFTAMLESAKTLPGFGGIMLYSLGDSDGYKLLNTNDEGVAEYNNYRNLLMAVAEDFGTPFASFDKQTLNINGENVIILDSAVSAADAVALFGTYGIEIDAENVSTCANVTVNALTSDATRSYTVAVVNDVNGDGSIDVKDIVRMKKIASGNVSGTAAEYAAAGTTAAEGIGSTELVDMRKVLLGI